MQYRHAVGQSRVFVGQLLEEGDVLECFDLLAELVELTLPHLGFKVRFILFGSQHSRGHLLICLVNPLLKNDLVPNCIFLPLQVLDDLVGLSHVVVELLILQLIGPTSLL